MTNAPITEFKGKYRFLSNFWPAAIEYEGIPYPTTEHAYQAAKVYDQRLRTIFASLPTAGDAKLLGRFIQIRPDWEDVKVQVMEDVLRLKFQEPVLKNMLLSTGDADLQEGNTWGDQFWGICKGQGKNILGELLMKIRRELCATFKQGDNLPVS